MSVKRWVLNDDGGIAWLYVDDKLVGSFLKWTEATLSVTFNRDLRLFYGFYENEDDLQWIQEKYDLLHD